MSQLDWVSGAAQKKNFKDIRNTKPGVAEEKAQLSLLLGALINKAPSSINSASIDTVRRWKIDRTQAAKIAANKRSSVQELTSAITRMRSYL